MGLNKLILVDKRNRLGGYMMTIAIIKSRRRTVYDDNDKMHMIRYNFTDNESYGQMVITMKIHWSRFLRVGIDLLLTTLGVADAQFFGHHQDRVIRLWAKFGLDTWRPCRDMRSLPAWRPPEVKGHQIIWVSPKRCHESMYQVWLYVKLKGCWETGLLPFWRLRRLVDWLSRPNGFEFEKAVWHMCSAWSEDHIWQVSWRFDRICGLWICSIDFDIFQHSGQILMFPWKIIYELYGEVWQYHPTLNICLKYTHVKREELKHIFINYSAP